MSYVIATSPECLSPHGHTLLMHFFQEGTYKKGQTLQCLSFLLCRKPIHPGMYALPANNADVFSICTFAETLSSELTTANSFAGKSVMHGAGCCWRRGGAPTADWLFFGQEDVSTVDSNFPWGYQIGSFPEFGTITCWICAASQVSELGRSTGCWKGDTSFGWTAGVLRLDPSANLTSFLERGRRSSVVIS